MIFAVALAMVNNGRERACRVGIRYGRRDHKLRLGSWNIGTLSGKSIELVKILQKHKVNIACVQATRWTGAKARDKNGYKLWYTGATKSKNGVGVIVDSDLCD